MVIVVNCVVSFDSETLRRCQHVGHVGSEQGVSQTSISLHGVQISSKGSALGLTGLHTDIRGRELVVERRKLGIKLIKFGVKLGVNLVLEGINLVRDVWVTQNRIIV